MILCQFTGVGSSTEKSGRRELKVREAGEQGTGGGRFWPPTPPEYTWSVEWKSEHTWEPQEQQVNCLIKDPPKEPKLALRDSKQPDATRKYFRCGGQFHGADNSRYNEGPLHFFHDVWMGIFALRETWMRIYFFRDLWIYIFVLPRETGFRFFRIPWNMHLLLRDFWTNDFCGNNFSLFWRF